MSVLNKILIFRIPDSIKPAIVILLLSITLGSSSQTCFPPEAISNPQKYKSVFDNTFKYSEINVFSKARYADAVILENGYAEAVIKNPESWTSINNKIAYQVDVVFTKYPWKKEEWLTNYYELLAKRLDKLFQLDPNLNSSDITWNLVLQTDCKTEEETKNYFHGIVIRYKVKNSEASVLETVEKADVEKSILKVTSFMDYLGGAQDASVYYAFNIIKKTKNTAVVMDWTGSMYVHSAQAILWHLKKLQDSGIKYFSFFNDGDRLPEYKKPIGNTGGIYMVESDKTDSLIALMEHVMKQGTGGDWDENDFEAIIKTKKHFGDIDEVILIADNNSGVRDYSLLEDIDVPVNVIVCGAENMVNIHYINLAHKTGGSLYVNGVLLPEVGAETNEDGKFYVLKHKYKIDENDNVVPCMEIDSYFFEKRETETKNKKEEKKKKHKEPGCPQF